MKKLLIILLLNLFILSLFSAVEVFSEDFEDGVIPENWTQEYVSGVVDWEINQGGQNDHPPAAHTGMYNAWFFDSSTDGNKTRLITPEFSLTTHSKLTFWYIQDSWTSYQDFLRVYYRPAPDAGWTLLADFLTEENEWTEVVLDLPEPSESYSLAFEGEAYWGYGVCIDDITVEDCVFNIFVWDNDNNSDYTDPNSGQNHNCEYSITESLDAIGLEYDQRSSLPADLIHYDIVMIELGLYCVG